MTIYISSDLHLNHSKDFVYNARGFHNVTEHDKEIIQRWNSIVRPQDDVYFLGDIGMGRDLDYLKYQVRRLNGTLHWIRGNHDTVRRWEVIGELPNVQQEGWAKILKHRKYKFWLSHYPTLTAPIGAKPVRQSLINLCGHSHTKNKFEDWDKYDYYIYHCEADAHNCFPKSLDDIIDEVNKRDKYQFNYWGSGSSYPF